MSKSLLVSKQLQINNDPSNNQLNSEPNFNS